MKRAGFTKLPLHAVANGYEFFLEGVTHRVVFEEGCWVLQTPAEGDRMAFESFNEAMNCALEGALPGSA